MSLRVLSRVLLTVYFWVVTIVSTLVTLVVSLCVYPFVDQKTFARVAESSAGYIMIKAMTWPGFWTIKITNPHNITFENNRYIIIANHASLIDSLIAVLLPTKKKFIIGKVFTKVPIFGQLCLMAGHVPVDEHDPSTTRPAVAKSVTRMADGCSLMIYPEGSRSTDPHKLLRLKTGAFRISQETKVPILPLTILGTGKAMPIGAAFCDFADIEIIIGEPFQVGEGWDQVQLGVQKSRLFIESHLNKSISFKNKSIACKNK